MSAAARGAQGYGGTVPVHDRSADTARWAAQQPEAGFVRPTHDPTDRATWGTAPTQPSQVQPAGDNMGTYVPSGMERRGESGRYGTGSGTSPNPNPSFEIGRAHV